MRRNGRAHTVCGGGGVARSRRPAGPRRFGRAAAGLVACVGLTATSQGWAGEADVMVARVTCTDERVCTFSVTVKHADTGNRHYADRYEILAPDGSLIATRVMRHPHVHEQPFTRTLGGVEVPAAVDRVSVRAHDSVHGFGGDVVTVAIPEPGAEPPSGDDD